MPAWADSSKEWQHLLPSFIAVAVYLHHHTRFAMVSLADGSKARHRRWAWWRLPPSEPSPLALKLVAALYHMSPSRDAAWAALGRSLAQGLVQPPDSTQPRRVAAAKAPIVLH